MKTRERSLGALLIGLLVAGVVLVPTAPARADDSPDLRYLLEQLTSSDGMTGAVVHTRDRAGRATSISSGTAKRGTGRPMVDGHARYRSGSLTKPVVAATVLRLVEADRIDLAATIETYLPGIVRGHGAGAAIDGRTITVRHLLQQTSGLPEFSDLVDPDGGPYTDRELLDHALRRAPAGAPGQTFSYANTNYLLLGMMIRSVTGKDFRTVSQTLVLAPLGMRHTYWPAPGDLTIRGRHAHFYTFDADNGWVDVTRQRGYELGASGGLISTPDDLDRFWQGLFGGRLLSPETLRTMTAQTVPVEQPTWPPDARYGFGMARVEMPCAGRVWMHGGGLPGMGMTTLSGWSRSGRAATVYVTGNLQTAEGGEHLQEVLDRALCRR